ncbi:hypothetical protein GCM10009660_01480 [Catellatospora bangladeshensis]
MPGPVTADGPHTAPHSSPTISDSISQRGRTARDNRNSQPSASFVNEPLHSCTPTPGNFSDSIPTLLGRPPESVEHLVDGTLSTGYHAGIGSARGAGDNRSAPPVLSLAGTDESGYYWSGGAEAITARHRT